MLRAAATSPAPEAGHSERLENGLDPLLVAQVPGNRQAFLEQLLCLCVFPQKKCQLTGIGEAAAARRASCLRTCAGKRFGCDLVSDAEEAAIEASKA
jgi:hypothetical protein